jgi:outer membrane protein
MRKLLTAFLVSGFIFSPGAKASESEDFVLKFRGLFNTTNGKWSSLPKQYTPSASANPQSIGKMVSNGFGGEVALTMHLTDQIAGEVASGLTMYRTKGSTLKSLNTAYSTTVSKNKKKDLYAIPSYVSLQYHIAPYGAIRPYIGGGYHYTYMQGRSGDYKVNNASGALIQAGVDLVFKDDTYINLDVKQYFLKTKVRFNQGFIRDQAGKQISPSMKLDPMSIGLGIGFKL